MAHLKNHLMAELREDSYTGDLDQYTAAEQLQVVILGNRLYRHAILRVNSTTYDMRRIQDSINLHTRPFIMYLSSLQDNAFPYEFALVLGIFHAYIIDNRPDSLSRSPKLVEFLWIRRLHLDTTPKSGWRSQRLHRVGFVPTSSGNAFAFLNPTEVIQGVHLIPAFSHGQTDTLLGPSYIRHEAGDKDWKFYYVNQ
jgi:hypothetical protein